MMSNNGRPDGKIGRLMRSDLLIRSMNQEIMRRAVELRLSTVAYFGGEPPEGRWERIEAYRYMIRPDACCPMPVVEATAENIRAIIEYNRKRANRIRAVLVDFNGYRNGLLQLDEIREGLLALYRKGIPVIFGSGASSPEELVGPAVLRAATRVLITGFDPASSIIYRRFYEELGRIFGGSRDIKKVL